MNLDDITLPGSQGTEKKLSRKLKIRIVKVADWVRQGCSKTKIIEMLQTEENLGYQQAIRTYRATMDYLSPTEEEQDDIRASVVSALQDIVEEARKDKDRANAIKALQQLSKISGLETQRIDANVNGNVCVSFDFGELNTNDTEDEDDKM